jgi:hypothetical protein
VWVCACVCVCVCVHVCVHVSRGGLSDVTKVESSRARRPV